MQVLPAVDVSHGRLARLESGIRVPVEAFDGDPLRAARAFSDAGAPWTHLVDMDRAFEGVPTSLELISAIAALGPSVQTSGGITDAGEIAEVLDAGAQRAVLSSAALVDLDGLASLIEVFGQRLVVGLETDGTWIRPRGRWGEQPGPPIDLMTSVGAAVGMGASRLLLTHVGHVGAMQGMDEASIRMVVARAHPVPVVASGGAGSLEELASLSSAGLEGVVVGRALYDGGLELAAAIEVAAGAFP